MSNWYDPVDLYTVQDIRDHLDLERREYLPLHETQESITDWANETFGEPESNLSIALRAQEEMMELIGKLTDDDDSIEAPIEAADVIIILMRLFSSFNVPSNTVITAKMEVNRKRKWLSSGDGHGYHVKEDEDA